jgi:hypothetical protein
MSAFRGSEETLDREIATLERVARQRLRRYSHELRELEDDLRELRRIRARKRAESDIPLSIPAPETIAES